MRPFDFGASRLRSEYSRYVSIGCSKYDRSTKAAIKAKQNATSRQIELGNRLMTIINTRQNTA
jgi:hypothetical protein